MPRYNNQKKTLKYTDEFKGKAVLLTHEDGARVRVIAQMLDIHPFMLSRWRKEFREGLIPVPKTKKASKDVKKKKSEHDQIRALEKENESLKLENELLKKWQRFLAEQKHNDSDS